MTSLAAVWRALAAARRLTAADWVVVAEAWAELARADVAVSARRYPRWRPVLDPAPGSTAPGDPAVVALFERAAAKYPRADCLRRAIALRSMLARRGYAARIRFGVRRDGATTIDAHAWVEVGGHVAETRSDVRQRYVALHGAGGRAA